MFVLFVFEMYIREKGKCISISQTVKHEKNCFFVFCVFACFWVWVLVLFLGLFLVLGFGFWVLGFGFVFGFVLGELNVEV